MKKTDILLILLLIITSCKSQNNTIEFKVFETEVGSINNVNENKSKFFDNYSLSMVLGHHNYRLLNDELYQISLSANNKNIYVYNATKDSLIIVPLKNDSIPNLPIEQIYYHNQDSVFIFYDRSTLMKIEFEKSVDLKIDFLLINSKGVVKNYFSLDDVPFIHYRSPDKMIMKRNHLIQENQIIDNCLIIPFSIYRPNPSQWDFRSFWPKMLCSYNLKTKKVLMLDVKFPEEDIGKFYGKRVLETTIDFRFNHRGNIYYVHQHSPNIYEFDVKNNKLLNIIKYPENLFYNNKGFLDSTLVNDSLTRSDFYAPVYYKKENVYIRKISLEAYKDYMKLDFVQILDKNLNVLGYSFADSLQSSIYVSGGALCRFNMQDRVTYNHSLGQTKKMKLNEIENEFFKKKIKAKKKKKNLLNISIEDRLFLLIKELKIAPGSKVITINTNRTCSTCIKFLMEMLKENIKKFEEENIYYLFTGYNKSFTNKILKNYKIPETKVVILEYSGKSFKYIYDDERNYYYFIDYSSDGKFEIEKANFREVSAKMEVLILK
ncbi:MAG: hypothetical protein U9R42_10110 [Bacteroidota bacterium]|nr:hypothetical protein [Bacteroidota bacterium]